MSAKQHQAGLIAEPGAIQTVLESFNQNLQHEQHSATIIWTIQSREDLFRHINNMQSRHASTRCNYTVRIDGILTTLAGFVHVIQSTGLMGDGKKARWSEMIWGSASLAIVQLYERNSGQEQVLALLEDLTTNTKLPSSPAAIPTACFSFDKDFLLQLFKELTNGILRLALSLQRHPQAPQIKTVKYQSFVAEHELTVQRVRSWASKLYPLHSHSAPAAASVQHRQMDIPVHINKNFHGRKDEILRIYRNFSSSIEHPAVQCIYGLPAIGKTQLAAQYCRTHKSAYTAIMWIDADTRTKILSAMSKYAVQFELSGADVKGDQLMNVQALVSWLQTIGDQWLLVFDNVDEVKLLDDVWPSGGNGHIIITARNPYTCRFRSASPLHLKPLSQDDTRALFYMIIEEHLREQHSDHMESILAEWEGSPLAVNSIGNYINCRKMKIHHFVKLYQKYSVRMLKEENYTDSYPYTIATAFPVRELEPKSKALLQSFCFLDPDGIPADLFPFWFEQGHEFGVIGNHMDYYDSIMILRRGSLAHQGEDDISIHRLVQLVAYSDMNNEERIQTFKDTVKVLVAIFPRESHGEPMWSDWALCDKYLPHVMFLCKRYKELNFNERYCAELASLLGACTWYMFERGLFSEAEPLVLLAQHVCPETFESLPILADVLFSMAGLRFECSRVKESLDLCLRVLKIRESILDPLDPSLGNTLFSMGIVCMEDNQLEKSLAYHLRAVEIHRACQDRGTHNGSPTAFAYMDLALCYWKMGLLDQASEYAERGVALFKTTSGVKSQKYGHAMYTLGHIREAQNRIPEAFQAFSESLEVCKSITPTHFKTGLGLHRMGSLLHKQADYQGALSCLYEALRILENSIDSNTKMARTTYKIAEVLEDMGRTDEASVKRKEAERLRTLITTFEYDPESTPEAFDSLVLSFLR